MGTTPCACPSKPVYVAALTLRPRRRNKRNNTLMMRWISIALLAVPAFAGTSLDDGYREMYNLDFAAAHGTFAEYQKLHPGDPMGPVSDAAAYLFSELDRLHVLQSEFFTHDQHFVTDHKLVPDPLARR